MEEMVDVIDESGTVLRQVLKTAAHAEGLLHRTVIGRDENHLFVVYEIATDDPIVLNEESVHIERFGRDDLKQALADKPGNFGDAYYFILETFYPEYLPPTWERRWS